MSHAKPLPLHLQAFVAGTLVTLVARVLHVGSGVAGSLLVSLTWCSLAAILMFIIDRLVVYPYMRSPLRHKFPAVFDNKLWCCVDILRSLIGTPRGRTAFEWFKRHPGVDAIHAYDPLLGDIIMPISPNALRDVLSTHAQDYVKAKGSAEILSTVGGKSLVFTSGSEYTRFRKAIHPFFSLRTTRKIHDISWQKSEVLANAIVDKSMYHGYHDPWPMMFRFVLDSVSEGFLSYRFDSMESGWNDPSVRTLQRTLTPNSWSEPFIAMSVFAPPGLLLSLPTRNIRSLKEVSRQLRRIASDILSSVQTLNKQSAPDSDEILRSVAARGDLSDEEMVETILTFLTAGIETTTAALTWSLHVLTTPAGIKYQAELRQELHRQFSRLEYRSITSKDLESIPLLHGIVEETLRLYPPIPLLSHEAQRDTVMVGQHIPKDTKMLYWMWALNRNPTYWGPDAEVMNPYRWMSTDEHGVQRPNKHGGASSNYCYESFLHGPRACVGRDTSKATMRAALAKLVYEFEITRDPEGVEEPLPRGAAIMRPVKSLKVKFSPVCGRRA